MVASTIPGNAKMIRIPPASNHRPSHPCGPKRTMNMKPATTGESENGRSRIPLKRSFPKNLWRARTSAMITPKNVFNTTAATVMPRVSQNA